MKKPTEMPDEMLWSWRARRHDLRAGEVRDGQGELLDPDNYRDSRAWMDPSWFELIAILGKMNDQLFELSVECFRTKMIVTGSVISETAKHRILSVITRYCTPKRIKLANKMEVTAPFRPAEDHEYERPVSRRIAMDSAFVPPPSEPPAGIAVDRYPAIRSDQLPVEGATFRFEVDLKSEPDPTTDSKPVTFEDVPGNWRSMEVGVEVHSSRLIFKEGENRKTITVMREGTTFPVSFSATVSASTGNASPLEVVAIFTYRDRFSGAVKRSFEVLQAPVAAPQVAMSGSAGSVRLIATDAPDLTVKIISLDGDGNYLWSLDAQNGRKLGLPSREGRINLGKSTGEYAAKLLKECPNMGPPSHVSRLRGIGENIWKASPDAFKALYKDLHIKFGPEFAIQIVTDEPHIPWEMMHPDDASGVTAPDHLFMTHPIARWFLSTGGIMPSEFEPGSIASFVPDYRDGNALPAALEEGRWLQRELGAIPQNATYENFTEFWGSKPPVKPVAVLHFAGHGDIDAAGVARIELLDGWVDCNEVHSGVILGRRDGTFVVLNACKTGVVEYQIGLVSGWAASLTGHGFGGVLAPLWAVQDECASQIVQDHLQSFIAGTALGRAMLGARAVGRLNSSTPYAYVLHGDVMARMKQAAV